MQKAARRPRGIMECIIIHAMSEGLRHRLVARCAGPVRRWAFVRWRHRSPITTDCVTIHILKLCVPTLWPMHTYDATQLNSTVVTVDDNAMTSLVL